MTPEQIKLVAQHAEWVEHGDCADPTTAAALRELLKEHGVPPVTVGPVPCPLGCKPKPRMENDGSRYWVQCTECLCGGPSGGDEEEAVTNWNTRIRPSPAPAPLPCPCCGEVGTQFVHSGDKRHCQPCGCDWRPDRRAPCPACAGNAKTTVEVDAFRRDRDAWKEAYYEAYRVSKGWEEEAIESSAKLEELNARVEKGKKQFAEMRGDIESLRADVAQAKGDFEMERGLRLLDIDRAAAVEKRNAEAARELRASPYFNPGWKPYNRILATLEGRDHA